MWIKSVVLEYHSDISIFGGTSFISLPSIENSPFEISSSPATIRNVVDFPHPEGMKQIQ